MNTLRFATAGVLVVGFALNLMGCAGLEPTTIGSAPATSLPTTGASTTGASTTAPSATGHVIRGQQAAATPAAEATAKPTVIRGQNAGGYPQTGAPPYTPSLQPNNVAPAQPYTVPSAQPGGAAPTYPQTNGQPVGPPPTYPQTNAQPPAAFPTPPPGNNSYVGPIPPAGGQPYVLPAPSFNGAPPAAGTPGVLAPTPPMLQPNAIGPSVVGPSVVDQPPVGTPVPVDVYVQEARTGRFMLGVGVNSDAGVTGQIVIDERNFDIARIPTSWDDIINGTAFRGAGQGFRIEAMPGNQVQRYLVSFTEPYLFNTPVSLNLSGFLFDRRFFDWDEQRLGGRVSLGYRLTHDLSLATAIRAENVNIHDPRVVGVEELDEVLGDNELYSGRITLTHDTRDVPFFPTEGHLIELAYEQVFGSFDYPRAEFDFRKYFLLRERADGSGRHTLAAGLKVGLSGSQTPIYENYFAGGFSTIRGFEFRGASPVDTGVTVGGQFQMLGSLEYFFPITADDMLKGVLFCDYGTVEREIELVADNFRVAPGFGLRIAVPALGPAPLALDFAFPVAHAETDEIQNFSFFIGVGRS